MLNCISVPDVSCQSRPVPRAIVNQLLQIEKDLAGRSPSRVSQQPISKVAPKLPGCRRTLRELDRVEMFPSPAMPNDVRAPVVPIVVTDHRVVQTLDRQAVSSPQLW